MWYRPWMGEDAYECALEEEGEVPEEEPPSFFICRPACERARRI